MIDFVENHFESSENYCYLAAHTAEQIYSPRTEFYYRQLELLHTWNIKIHRTGIDDGDKNSRNRSNF